MILEIYSDNNNNSPRAPPGHAEVTLGPRGVRVEADDRLRRVQDLGGGHQEGAVSA